MEICDKSWSQKHSGLTICTHTGVGDTRSGDLVFFSAALTTFLFYDDPIVYLSTKVLHGYFKPVFITLIFYASLTLPVIEFPFQKELFSGIVLEKRPLTMALTSMGMILNKHGF